VVTVFALWLAFKSYSLREVTEAIAAPNYWWLIPNLSLGFLAMLIQALRWKTLLSPLAFVPVVEVFSANSIGQLVNNIVPFRLGEYARVLTISRDNKKLTKPSLLATVMVERLIFDAGMLTLVVAGSIAFIPIRWQFNVGILAVATGTVMISVMLFIATAAFEPRIAISIISRLLSLAPATRRDSLRQSLTEFAEVLPLLRQRTNALKLVCQTVLIWSLMMTSIYCLFRAFGFVLPATAPVAFLGAVVLAMFLPSLPGHIGTFHLAAVLTLTAYGITDVEGRAFAIVVHLSQFVPTSAIGLFFLHRSNLTLGIIRRRAMEVRGTETEEAI